MGWQNFHDFRNKLLTPNHGDLFKDLKKKLSLKHMENMDVHLMD